MFVLASAPSPEAKSSHPDARLLRGEVLQKGDWLVACDNGGDCTMLGFPQARAAGSDAGSTTIDLALQISLKRSPDAAAPVVELVRFGRTAASQSTSRASPPFLLDIQARSDGGVVPNGHGPIIVPVHDRARASLGQREALAVLNHLSAGRSLGGREVGGESATVQFPRHGTQEALRTLKRAHYALSVRLRANPAATAQKTGPAWRLRATPAMVSGFVPVLTRNSCASRGTRNFRRFTFSNGADLWIYECEDQPARHIEFLAMSDRSGKLAAPIELPDPRDGPVPAGRKGLSGRGFAFDFDFGILRHYAFAGEREDCGIFRAWGYTAHGWRLLERREMALCMGLPPEHWIRTHTEASSGAGPGA